MVELMHIRISHLNLLAEQLVVLANLENLNAEYIKQKLDFKAKRNSYRTTKTTFKLYKQIGEKIV